MIPSDQNRRFELFERALELGDEARVAYLQEHTESKDELDRILSLLAADASNEGMLERCDPSVGKQLAGLVQGALGEVDLGSANLSSMGSFALQENGQRFGTYTIERQLGRGGMGVVYLARQDRTSQWVALKCLLGAISTPEVIRRFEREAAVLGRLDHPGIAKVFEAGTVQVGTHRQHFFAMEYVRGKTLLDHVRDEELDLRERVELVALVCDAVHHAHAHGVIHRDIKPNNILVSANGQPKVLDFGVSRIVDKEFQATTMGTETGQLIGTLCYMSPEQAGGDPGEVDETSDVYALGVVLYELVCGRLPHDLDGQTLFSAVRSIREQRPLRLSAINTSIPADIATIAERALERDRERRFASVGEMALELRRFLRHEPILTRPASALYLIRKFTQRHRLLVASTGLTILSLLAAVVVSVFFHFFQAQSADALRKQKIAAEREGYIANLASAKAALRVHDVAQARLRLESVPASWRGWEWRHWFARLDQSLWTYFPPGGWPRRARFDAKAERVLVADTGGGLSLLDAEDAKLHYWVQVSDTRLTDAIFVGAGERLAVSDRSGKLSIHDAREGLLMLNLDGHEGPIGELVALPEQKGFVSVGSDGAISVWDPDRAQPIRSFGDAKLRLNCVDVSSDGRTLATGDLAGMLCLWDIESGVQTVLNSHLEQKVEGVRFSVDGKRLLACGERFLVYDLHEGRELSSWNSWEQVGPFAFDRSAQGMGIPVASGDNALRIWDWEESTLGHAQRGHEEQVVSLDLSADSLRLVTASFDGSVKAWAPDGRGDLKRLARHDAYVNCVAFAPGGGSLLSAGMNRQVHRWNPLSLEHIGRVAIPKDVYDLAFSSNGERYAIALRDHSIELRSSESDAVLYKWMPSSGSQRVSRLAFHEKGSWLVACTQAGEILLFDTADLKLLGRHSVGSSATALALHPTQDLVALGDESGHVRLVELPALSLRLQWQAHSEPVTALAYGFQGECLVSGSADASIQLWNADGELQERLLGHNGSVQSLVFDGSSTRMFSAGSDQAVLVWETATWKELTRLEGHTWAIRDLALSPDGSQLVSAGMDGELLVWRAP